MKSKTEAYILFTAFVGECKRGEGDVVKTGTTGSSVHGYIYIYIQSSHINYRLTVQYFSMSAFENLHHFSGDSLNIIKYSLPNTVNGYTIKLIF